MDNCYFSDAYRMDTITEFFNNVKDDDSYNIEEPDFDSLLDPYNGYEKQIYIQNDLENNQIVFWEGWSHLCWDGAYSKPEYKGKNKQEVLDDVLDRRFKLIANECGLEIVDSDYFFHETWDDYIKDDYIMKIILKK
jgi:hypothetical protein